MLSSVRLSWPARSRGQPDDVGTKMVPSRVPRVRSRPIRLMYWLVLALSAVVLFIAVWILVPAPNALVLPLGVAAPELSPVLLAISVALMAAAAVYARSVGTARLALVLSAVSAIVCLWPLLRVPSTLRRFDETMKQGLGIDVAGRPISYAALFRPPRALNSHVVRGVQVTERGGSTVGALSLDIYKPSSGTGPFPILVQIYGGAWQRGAPSANEWFAP